MNKGENTTGPDRSISKAVLAGRVFKRAFDSLGSGDRARLRRAEDPQTVGAFWTCFNPALREHDKAYAPLYADTVSLLDLLVQKDDPELNLGRFLAGHRNRVALRRVEALFGTEHREELLDNLESLFIMLKGASIDYGLLIADLSLFRYSHARIRQRWAASFFKIA